MTVQTTGAIKINSVMAHSSLLLYNGTVPTHPHPTCIYVCVCVSVVIVGGQISQCGSSLRHSVRLQYLCLFVSVLYVLFRVRARCEFVPMKWDMHVRKSVVQCVSERQKKQTKQNEKMR